MSFFMNNKISVVIPTLNEEGNVRELIERTHKTLANAGIEYELIFVDDHSSDNTVKVIESYSRTHNVKVELKDLSNRKKGKADSLLQGFELARYELIAMMDADLQYEPEEIVPMIQKLDDGFDVVQSCRKTHNEGLVRTVLSKGFNFVFIRVLHGLKLDTQSALKVFRTKILKDVQLTPTPWTFDLDFLIKARNAGYKITSHDINFEDRKSGESKINIRKAVWEIGTNALKLKFKQQDPIALKPEGERMIGAGHLYKGKRFVTHSVLPHHVSAIRVLVSWQKVFLWAVVIASLLGFAFYPLTTTIVLVAILSVVYFIDAVFNLFLVWKSLSSPPELNFTPSQIAQLNDEELPTYTILCPLYKEAHVLPMFLEAIAKLDWPKNKLDVQLLLEEDDLQTIESASRMNLPDYVRVIVVPHSLPKTKPKACNYGLSLATGDYLVVYDAEDLPEPRQLKKAYLGFQTVGPEVWCLQAKLNYFNPRQNLLTRLFTAEYSLWFDVVLPGLQSINTYIPLGGTSNHFRTQELLSLHGWDPFNVTEDCDLGARLFKSGKTTAIIDSVTLEEANSNVKNWIRQRSRWIKGYMQTYLVHMRNPIKFFQENGFHAGIFQLVVGGKITFLLINPLLWLTTIIYFSARATVGPVIESFFPPVVFYMAVMSLVFGNFAYLYYYMIGIAKRGHWEIMKYIFFVPVYWVMGCVAAIMALYQLIVKPHFWEKTHHGLHLKKPKAAAVAEAPSASAEAPAMSEGVGINIQTVPAEPESMNALFGREWLMKVFSGGGILIVTTSFINFLNFFFNAFLGRVLSFEQLALVTFINTLWSLVGLFIHAYGTTITHKVSYLVGQGREDRAVNFFKKSMRIGYWSAGIASIAWIALTPWLASYFNVSDLRTIFLFTPVLSFGVTLAASKAILEGRLFFKSLAFIYLFESVLKLGMAVAFVYLDMKDLVYLAIPGSILATGLLARLIASWTTKVRSRSRVVEYFPKSFYVSAIFSSLSTSVFLSLDVILVKHFLPDVMVGEYVLLALVGKMVFFFAILPNTLMNTFVSRDLGAKNNPIRSLYVLGGATMLLIGFGYMALAVFGPQILPLLLGSKVLAILQYTPLYILAISLFAFTKLMISYHLAKEQYVFPFASLITSVMLVIGIFNFHETLAQIVTVFFYSSLTGFILVTILHLSESFVEFIPRMFKDFAGAFNTLDFEPSAGKRILIFNWRDMRHKFAGGAEVYIHEMAKQWIKNGHSVTLFCGNDGKSPVNEVVDGINVIRRGGFYLVYVWAFFYYFTQFRGKFDVVIDCENGVPFFTPLYVKEKVHCLLFHVHQEVFRRTLSKPAAMLASFLEKDLMPLVYRKVKFITISASSRNEILETGLAEAGIDIVHPGVHTNTMTSGQKSRVPTVLYLGRLKAYKSVDVLIKAFFIIAGRIPDAQLVIAGNGEEEANLRDLVKQMDLEDRVVFMGKVSEKAKIQLMQKAWVFVNPSMMEGWGLTTVEANACGTPIVAADVPGLRDSVKHKYAGYLVEYGDYAAFAEKITDLIHDRKLRESMEVEARKWAENFDWRKTSRQFLSLILKESEAL
jgi:cellulose synthase/poly-beta-1,6-N-acetylglucosamine synthase-like glycosyltransferase/glycosyltransferase involved in cell wall biosynthesis/O-antigen/teichoic acid export membrane protein